MKPDITSRVDIEQVVRNFYRKLTNDQTMYPFFREIIEKKQLEHHLTIIVDFWEDLLFHSCKYKNNPMEKHLDFHQQMSFTKDHFVLWLAYLSEIIDYFFKGEVAENMKARANSIATVMQLKMNLYSDS